MIRLLARHRLIAAAALIVASDADARQIPDSVVLEHVVVEGRSGGAVGVADSATEGRITASQLATRPLLRPGEVLESVPGMTVTQHSGDGKANQYFLRGFNLDHGSDFSTMIDGMPVNMVSHGHGQGYTDLNFFIPELIGTVRYRKGPYGFEDGDFGVAGSARIDYARELASPFVAVTAGSYSYRRLLAADSRPVGKGQELMSAIETAATDGPWEQPERLGKLNGVIRFSAGDGNDGLTLTAMAYRARWTATEQVPQRAVEAREIRRFGTLAPSDGGRTNRGSLSASWVRSDERGKLRVVAYVIDYGLNLYSTPAGLLAAQHEQEDRRTIWGGSLLYSWDLGTEWRDTTVTAGLQVREDRIAGVGLFETEQRVRQSTVRRDRIAERGTGLLTELRTPWTSWLRSSLSLRLDQLRGRVTPLAGDLNMGNGGVARGSQLSPKLSLSIGPFAGTELYINAGRGFHSNDMRGATTHTNPRDGGAMELVPVLAKATSAEIGLRATPIAGWRMAISIWRTDLASELIYIGDEGVTEPKGASSRRGIEWWNDVILNNWLTMDADLALSRARFVDSTIGGTKVPNAVPLTASLSLSADRQGSWFGGLRLRFVGAYPLEEGGVRRSTALFTVNLRAGYRFASGWRVTMDVLNLLNRRANDVEYWGASCTRSEGSACNGGSGVDGRLIHPMEPRTLRLSLQTGF